MDNLLCEIGERMQVRRKQMRLTQEALAEKAGVTSQTISSAELGKKALRPENIIKISAALEISCDYLLLGKIGSLDFEWLNNAIMELPPFQYRHLEDMIQSFILALREKNCD